MPDRFRVIVVEDDVLVAMDLAIMIEELGAGVIGLFHAVAPALEMCRSQEVDFALIDFNLGTETSTELAEHLLEYGIPFAFLTGYDHRALPEQFRDCSFLEKPINQDTLATVLASGRAREGLPS